jgi:hypothetical protein
MARIRVPIRLARIALTKLQKAISSFRVGTRRVALESKKIAYESLVLSLLLYGSKCWFVSAENMTRRLLQRFHRKCHSAFGSCQRAGSLARAVTLGSITSRPRNRRRSWASTSIPRHQASCSFEGADSEILRARFSKFVWTQTGLRVHRSCSAVGWWIHGKQPAGKTNLKVLYDSAVQKLLDDSEVGLSLLNAANKSEWHNITRPEALAAQARAASGVPAQVAAQRPSAVTKGAASSTSRAASASVTAAASATCKPESRRNLRPTKPAIQISDADRKRKILVTDKHTMAFKKWRRVDRYRCIEGRCLHQLRVMSAKTKVTKTKTDSGRKRTI